MNEDENMYQLSAVASAGEAIVAITEERYADAMGFLVEAREYVEDIYEREIDRAAGD